MPDRGVLADARSEHHPKGERCDAPDRVDDTGTREVAISIAKAKVSAEVGKPTATPGPIGEDRIGERAHDERGDKERGVLPAFRRRAGHDGESRIHKDHLEEEQHHDGDVIGALVHQKQAVLAPKTERLAEKRDGKFAEERRCYPRLATRADAAHLDGEADQPIGEHADAVHHEVHHHGVIGVLGAAEAGFDDGETRLHEHDQEARDQGPHEVDGDTVLPVWFSNILDGNALLAIGNNDVATRCP